MEHSEDRKRWWAKVQRYRRQLTTQQRNEDNRITVREAILFAHWPVNSWHHPCLVVLSDQHLSTCLTWGTWCTCVYLVHVLYKEAVDIHFNFCEHIRMHLELNSTLQCTWQVYTVKDYLCVYLKACFSKVLSEVCSHDSLQEPSQGDNVGMASCPECEQKA